jgi:hypothetical protein
VSYQYGPQPRSSGDALAALILGICGIFVCPVICSVLAIVYGNRAKREIDTSGGWVTGREMAVAGIVIGWVGLAIYVLTILAFVLLFVILAAGSATLSGTS